MSMNTHSSHADEPMLEINTTPLIDVLLVLLVMLIITIAAPMQAVRMDLPTANPQQTLTPTKPISLVLAADGQLEWNGAKLADPEALALRLQAEAQKSPQAEIQLRPDPAAAYQQVVMVLSSAQRLGLQKLVVVGNDRFAH